MTTNQQPPAGMSAEREAEIRLLNNQGRDIVGPETTQAIDDLLAAIDKLRATPQPAPVASPIRIGPPLYGDDGIYGSRREPAPADRPRIVCLCGSTRFIEAWKKATREESLAGKIVLSVAVMIHANDEPIRDDSDVKRQLDELHKRKIDLADEVLVLNVGGYIGQSTRSEIEYAETHGKPVRYLEAI